MKSLQEILAEVQAVDTTELDNVVAALAQVIVDIQAVIDGTPVVADPVISITTTTQAGVTEVFVPQV